MKSFLSSASYSMDLDNDFISLLPDNIYANEVFVNEPYIVFNNNNNNNNNKILI